MGIIWSWCWLRLVLVCFPPLAGALGLRAGLACSIPGPAGMHQEKDEAPKRDLKAGARPLGLLLLLVQLEA